MIKNIIIGGKRKAMGFVIKAHAAMVNRKAEGFVDSGVKILIAVVIGALLLGILLALPMLISAVMKEGSIGGADIKLTGASGFLLGLERGLVGLIAGLILAVAINMIYRKVKKLDTKAAFPLVPHLAAGNMLAYLCQSGGILQDGDRPDYQRHSIGQANYRFRCACHSGGKYNLPENTIKKKEDAVGKYSVCDLKSNDFLMTSKVTVNAGNAEEILKSLDASKQAISVTISSFAAGLSGKLKNGDIISVIQARKDGQTAVIPPELKYVKVITTTTSSGYDTESQEEKEDQEKELPSTVTLLVNSEQSKLLTTLEQNGGIHASLVFRENTEQANEFLAAQDAVFAEGTGDA